jgi:hypothetical protein
MQQHPNLCQELRRSSQTQVVSSLPADGPGGGHEVCPREERAPRTGTTLLASLLRVRNQQESL